jgi:membrane protein required for colicin V production
VNFIDVIVLVVIGLSALIAFSNGFVNVILWIMSWVGAVFATIYFFPMARPIAERYIAEPLIANVVTAVAIFIVALIICAILNQIISRAVRGSAIGAIDRSLGLLLGLVIGAVIVCGAYMLMVWAIPDERDRPQSIAEAKTLPMVQKGADLLRTMVPAYVIEQGQAVIDQGVKTLGDPSNLVPKPGTPAPQPGALPPAPAPQPGQTGPTPPAPAAPAGGTGQTQGSNANPAGNPDGQAATAGYKDAQRNDLDRLIESSQ